MRAACTIVSPNYHKFAQTLSTSYLAAHRDDQFFVLVVASLDLSQKSLFEGRGYTPVFLQEIGVPDLLSVAMKYDILELNTNVKPSFLKFLLLAHGIDELIYLDPDIFVYQPLLPVFEALTFSNAILTPHMTSPINDGKTPGEQEMLYNGTYNLGFIAVRRSEETMRLLTWWETRCLQNGFSEGRTGLFVDQKWMNLARDFFDGVASLRHPGCNMAFWNLHERDLSKHGSTYKVCRSHDLCFFHFSGLDLHDDNSISKNTNRYTLKDRPDLVQLIDTYKENVAANTDPAIDALTYGYGRFTDGTVITRLARRIYAAHLARWPRENPFDAKGVFALAARRLRLVAGSDTPPKNTWHQFRPYDKRVKLVHNSLRWVLQILGPNRYELLMRYLGHITILRNQSLFLK